MLASALAGARPSSDDPAHLQPKCGATRVGAWANVASATATNIRTPNVEGRAYIACFDAEGTEFGQEETEALSALRAAYRWRWTLFGVHEVGRSTVVEFNRPRWSVHGEESRWLSTEKYALKKAYGRCVEPSALVRA